MLKVINFAEENNNRDAGRKFNVDESQVRRWRQKKNSFLSETDAKRRKLQGGGRKPVLGEIEEELMQKIFHEREQHHHVPCKLAYEKQIKWVLDASETVKPDIKKSFECCGITTIDKSKFPVSSLESLLRLHIH